MAGGMDLARAYRMVGDDMRRRIAANEHQRHKLLAELELTEKELRILQLELENHDLRKQLEQQS